MKKGDEIRGLVREIENREVYATMAGLRFPMRDRLLMCPVIM